MSCSSKHPTHKPAFVDADRQSSRKWGLKLHNGGLLQSLFRRRLIAASLQGGFAFQELFLGSTERAMTVQAGGLFLSSKQSELDFESLLKSFNEANSLPAAPGFDSVDFFSSLPLLDDIKAEDCLGSPGRLVMTTMINDGLCALIVRWFWSLNFL